jgi:hypothetical protein
MIKLKFTFNFIYISELNIRTIPRILKNANKEEEGIKDDFIKFIIGFLMG